MQLEELFCGQEGMKEADKAGTTALSIQLIYASK